ncbi:hypothetical protein [Streptomyces sp. NPDC048248]
MLHRADDPLIKPGAGRAIASRISDARLVLLADTARHPPPRPTG